MLRYARRTALLAIAALVAAGPLAAATDSAATHEIVATVVAIDLQAKSIRAEIGSDPTQSFTVVGKAADMLDQVPIGRTFKLTLRDGEGANGRVVVAIKRTKGPSKP